MKSVLLGGLKVWLVNDGGKPLSAPGGRAKFYTAGTSTPETVYSDIDLTQSDALGPVVYTDELGYLPAIWLKTDRLYKVRVEQKVPGSGNQWTLLWEVDDVGYIDRNTSDEIGNIPIFVNSISELKTVDHTENPVVEVLGYYNPGDWGESSVFVFDPECVKAPDDGAYVLPSNQQQSVSGRWVQQFSGYVLDVRKFGALPDMDSNSDVSAKLVNAVHYSQDNSTRTRPITVGFVAPGRYDFVGNFDFSQYTFTDIADNNTVYPIQWFIGNDVVFNSLSVSTSTFTLSKNTECLTVNALVSGNCNLAVEGGGKIKVDPAWWGSRNCEIEDCIVECHSATTNAKHFERCVVTSNYQLGGNIHLEEMGFDESWLVHPISLGDLTLTDVRYTVADCITADTYIAIKNSQGDSNYGDMLGKTVNNAVMINGYVKLYNCNGTVSVTATGYTELDLKDFNGAVSFPMLPSETLPRIYAENSAVRINGSSVQLAGLTARNVRLSGTHMLINGPLYMEGCVSDNAIECVGDVTFKCSVINEDVIVKNSDLVRLILKDNTVNATVTVAGVTANTVVNASINGNHGLSDTPIDIARTNIDPVDSHHTYSYSGNTGTFLPDITEPELHTFVIKHVQNIYTDSNDPYILQQNVLGSLTSSNEFNFLGSIMVYYEAGNFDTVKFFRIGTDRFRINAKMTSFPALMMRTGTNYEYACNTPCEAQLGAYFIDGFMWGVRPWFDDPSNPSLTFDEAEPYIFKGSRSFGQNDHPTFVDYNVPMSIQYENMDKHL